MVAFVRRLIVGSRVNDGRREAGTEEAGQHCYAGSGHPARHCLHTILVSEEPLRTEEKGSWHAGMSNPKSDAAFTRIVEVFLVHQIDDIASNQHLLLVPRQREHVSQ